MGITRLFLLDAHVHDVQINDALEAACLEAGYPVSRLRVDANDLDGSDVAALDLIDEVRRLMSTSTEQGRGQAVLIGYGLSATLALWMDMVDLARPKKIQVGKFDLEVEDAPPDVAPALAGVVAIAPFLGTDFSVRSGRLGAEGASDLRLRLCRKPFWARLIGGWQWQTPEIMAAAPWAGCHGRCLPRYCPSPRWPSWYPVASGRPSL